MAEPAPRLGVLARRLSGLVLPLLALVVSVPVVFVARGCVSDAPPYALIVAHEAPATGRGVLSLGSSASDDLLLTEPRVEEHHGELLDAGGGAFEYRHRTFRASAELQEPGPLGTWRSVPGAPRHELPAGADTVVLTGLPADGGPDDGACAPERQSEAARQVLRPVDAARVAVRVDGDEVGMIDLPLVPGEPLGLGGSALRVCGARLDVVWGSCEGGTLLPLAASRLDLRRRWVPIPDLDASALGLASGSVALARVDGTLLAGRRSGLRSSHVLLSDALGSRLLAVQDRRQPEAVPDPLGGEPSLAISRRRAGGPLDLMAAPRPGTRVVVCGEHGPVEMGRARVEPGALLVAGNSRYSVSAVRRPWGPQGSSVEAVRLEPVARPEDFHLLTSLSAGRLLQFRGGFTLPPCDRDGGSFVVVRAHAPRGPGEAAGASPAQQAEEPAPVRVDEKLDLSRDDGGIQRSVDLPVPAWALARAGTAGGTASGVAAEPRAADSYGGDLPVLQLCHSAFTIRSRALLEPSSAGPAGAVLEPPRAPGDEGWARHHWGDRIAVAGQVIELRSGLARYERIVPLLLLWVIVALAALRVRSLLVRLRPPSPGVGLLSAVPPVVASVAFLLLLGCVLMGGLAAHPRLLASPDFLHRTWFAAVVAAFSIPAALAFFADCSGPLARGPSLRDLVVGASAAIAEGGLAAACAAVAAILDAGLWALLGGRPLLSPVRAQVWVTIAILALVAGLALPARRWVPSALDLAIETARSAAARAAALWRDRGRGRRDGAEVPASPGGVVPDLDRWIFAPSEGGGARAAESRSTLARTWEVFGSHPWIEAVFGPRARDLLVVLIAPLLLLVSSALALIAGGAAHNNLEFGFGLGLKPADLLTIVIGIAVATTLTRHWDRPDDLPRISGSGGAAAGTLARLRAWVAGTRDLPGGRDREGWTLRGLAAGVGAAAGAGMGLLHLLPWPVAAGIGSILALLPLAVPLWVAVGAAIVATRWGLHAAVVVGAILAWSFHLVGPVPAVSAIAGVAAAEAIVRLQPQLASLLAVLGLLVVVTILAFAVQGDFGPLMVTVPAILLTGAWWAMLRPREAAARASRRLLVVGVLMLLVLPGLLFGIDVASTMAEWVPDFQRANDRLLIWREPWYALGADWSVRGRWIAAGFFGEGQATWVANLHSDLAWVAVMRAFGAPGAIAVLGAYLCTCLCLVWMAEQALREAAWMERQGNRLRHHVRGAAIFCAFASFYLAAEVFVHVATCFTRIPPTGLTLPWISNGGSAALGYALLVGVAAGGVLAACQQAAAAGREGAA